MPKKVAIIGAGPSGLVSSVAALKEGLIPTVFEMSSQVGGVWSEQGSAWPSMKVNISRHTGTFFDFNWPRDSPDFPTTQEQYQYLSGYAKHHQLESHIKLNSRVTQILKMENQWLVGWEENQKVHEELFDSVIVAASKFTNPVIPDAPGKDKFAGKMLHSSKYRATEDSIGKQVLIVGGSLSGTSIAEELARKTAITHLIRKARWIVKRYRSTDPENNGPLLPRDMLKTEASSQKVLSAEEEYQFMLKHCSEQNDFPEWRMEPNSPVGFVVADDYLNSIRNGQIKPVVGDIKNFIESGIVLESGEEIPCDVVIWCTGYQRNLSFLPEGINLAKPLYEDTFIPEVPGLAFIGMYPGARGAVFPLIELQAALACKVLNDSYKLPSLEIMTKEIAEMPANRTEIQFMTSMAKKMGILPDLNSLKSDLRDVLVNGTFTSARFHLTGSDTDYQRAIKIIEETENHRRKLLGNSTPLVSLSIFKTPSPCESSTELKIEPSFS